jgi:chaperonin GroES
MDYDTNLNIDTILEEVNLAERLDEDTLNKIGGEVSDGYDLDCRSRAEWEQNIDQWYELAMQHKQAKSYPWPNAANVKYPLITTAALQFSARSYAALLPGTNIVRGRVIGYDTTGEKTERALRIGKHMSYQLLEEMNDWEEEMDRMLFSLPIVGCMFKKTYFDGIKGHNVSEIVYPKELVVNYWAKTLEDAERITHVLRMSENDIYERISGGLYLDIEPEKNISKFKETVTDNVTGQKRPEEDSTLPFLILEQHCYLDLDGDGYKEPYLVTVDGNSRKVLRIVARFDEDNIVYNSKGEMQCIKPTSYFTKFSFIPSPDGGFYDIGFGVLLGPINETINTLINQLLDSGTLSNMQAGFIGRGIRVKGGAKNFVPGEWKVVNTSGDDLRKGLVPLPVRDPSQVLFSLLGMMIESGERLSSVTEVMTGEIPGQNTKATVAMAAIEQGMKVFSSIYKRIHRSLSSEYRKLFTLNSIYLPEQAYFAILDVGQERASSIGLSDYRDEGVDVVPTSDPNVATEQQKLAKMQALFEVMQLGTINPQEVTRRYLEATEQPNVEQLMDIPERGPSPDEIQMQLEQQKAQIEAQQKWAEIEIKKMAAQAQAQLDLAKAQKESTPAQIEDKSVETVMKQQDLDIKKYGLDLNAQTELEKKRLDQETALKVKELEQQMKEDEKRRQEEEKEESGNKVIEFKRSSGGKIVGATITSGEGSKVVQFKNDGDTIVGATIEGK